MTHVKYFSPRKPMISVQEELANKFRRNLATKALKSLESQKFMDVQIVCSDHVLLANKLILASSSKVFYSIFQNNKPVNRIIIPELDPRAAILAIKYMKYGKLSYIPHENNFRATLRSTFEQLEIINIGRNRCDILARSLTDVSFLNTWNFARHCQYLELEQKIASFVVSNLEYCYQSRPFCSMKLNQMIAVLAKEELQAVQAFHIGNAVITWAMHDLPNRGKFLGTLFTIMKVSNCVRLNISHFVNKQLELLSSEDHFEQHARKCNQGHYFNENDARILMKPFGSTKSSQAIILRSEAEKMKSSIHKTNDQCDFRKYFVSSLTNLCGKKKDEVFRRSLVYPAQRKMLQISDPSRQ